MTSDTNRGGDDGLHADIIDHKNFVTNRVWLSPASVDDCMKRIRDGGGARY